MTIGDWRITLGPIGGGYRVDREQGESMTDQKTPPLSVAQARKEILMMADGDPQYWATLLDALIAAVRAEGAAQIAQLEAENQRLRDQIAQAQP